MSRHHITLNYLLKHDLLASLLVFITISFSPDQFQYSFPWISTLNFNLLLSSHHLSCIAMLLTHLMSGAEDPRFLRAVKSHPRYHLRLTAIIAAAFGIFFNVLAIAIAQELIMSGLAFIPVSDSYRQRFNSWLPQTGIDR